MAHFFSGIYQFFRKRRLLLFIVFFSLLAASGYFAFKLRLEEDISAILPKDKKIEKLNEVFARSKFMDRLVVMLSLKDSAAVLPDSLIAYGDAFSEAAEAVLPDYISGMQYRVDDELTLSMFDIVQEYLPVYLSEDDYRSIDSLITPAVVRNTLQSNLEILTSPAGFALKNIIAGDPAGISFLALKKLQQLQYDENFELYDNCIITRDHKTLLLFLTPTFPPNETRQNQVFLNKLDSLIATMQADFPAIETSYFGATAVSAGNAEQMGKDTGLTQVITVMFIVIFIGIYFRRATTPLLVMVPVVFGALFSLACVYLIRGSISIIAIGTGSIILGIAVNYSLHVLNHYRHTGSVKSVVNDLAFPLTIGGITTIGGFFCLNFAASEMLRDLGLFAGFTLIGASLCSLIFLPHFITAFKKGGRVVERRHSFIDRIASFRPEYNKYIILAIVVLTILFAYTSRKVGFESDMNNMSFMSGKLKAAESRLNRLNEAALQSVYVVAEGATMEEALLRNEALEKQLQQLKEQDIVSKYSGVSTLIMSDSLQRQRINRWNSYWTPEKKQHLLRTLQKEGRELGYSNRAFTASESLLNKEYTTVDTAAVESFRTGFLGDYINVAPGKTSVVTLLKVPFEHNEKVYAAFGDEPGVTALDKQYLTRRLVELINIDFTKIALITSLFVFTALLITYGRIELAFVAFLPMLISWVWILGIMGLTGIEFNIVNIIVSTLIFGLGDDYSIFIMDGLLQEYKTGRKNLSSFKSSIILSAVTTLTGLGVLIFAKHPALHSIAVISVTGILCVVLISQICIPLLFRIIIKNRVEKKRFPWTFWGWLRSVFANFWFILGSIVLVVVGIILVKLNPFNQQKGKDLFHVIIAKFSWSLIYLMPNVKKTIINPLKENFKKPAVIICNHQSGLDNFLMMMLHPKMILFTNDRVRNAPISGWVVKMADYFSASNGVEDNLEQLREKVLQGYSIAIFPEGTRSPDGNMKRFHKGAFFLAEKFQIDILPVIIHGSGYVMTKRDMLVKNGKITLQFLPRISPDNTGFGAGYAERAKKVGRYFKAEYEKLKLSVQQPSWYREQLFYNYIYKGPVLEWYMRVKVRLEKDYQPIHALLPVKGKILDIGCGYGFMSYMLRFTAPEREITGIDYDEEKIAVANHCFSRDAGIRFGSADATDYPLDAYDGIIIADMLHYLQEPQQKIIIEKAMQALNPQGVLLIREGNRDLKERHRGTKLTEFFSTRFFRFNKTAGQGLSFLSGQMIYAIAAQYPDIECTELDETKFTSNIIYVIKNKAPLYEKV
ncbi:MAG: 1-acyl-sn-glycerol-3-phosphate acyltransferase [Chitinophagaceae bacterium]|nr:1-acyl-sn-glycerol-3-phosphate acyltransferase [Chitinophagaceae bacterium]MCW5927353.1 1-acyl-sn-glycerol-3-phosphate acyltransferase [Chitinophagaceae bacterium]